MRPKCIRRTAIPEVVPRVVGGEAARESVVVAPGGAMGAPAFPADRRGAVEADVLPLDVRALAGVKEAPGKLKPLVVPHRVKAGGAGRGGVAGYQLIGALKR